MKRALLTILAVFYLGVSSGATVHFHYCMGQLVKLGLSQPDKPLCDFCKPAKKSCKKNCCKDDYKQAKTDKAQKNAAAVYHFKQISTVLQATALWSFSFIAIPVETGKAALSKAPPLEQDIPVFIRNCTYRI
ncbi:HYC_CC_PP family protein [Pedobacter psychroterrae]|uniref:Uncharacterized protein n=1 Tax=Pedobacter psychroterrae TaxID=2530453 RepID=A0A4R0NW77_9SPHI|nr:hypothetical protein [Pedobacter psychroterrae]TCD03845.1 hypothetical protein EZ437_07805 [Pedobacter psychroterrae]